MRESYMGVQLTLIKQQKLIDIFSAYYSYEDIFAIGRLIGIDKNRYYGFGMNSVQIAEFFVNCIIQNEKVESLFEVIRENEQYYRKEFDEFIVEADENIKQKSLCNGLNAIVIGINEYFYGGAENLKYAAADAEAFSDFIRNKWNISQKNILEYIGKAIYIDIMEGIRRMCASLTEEDNIVFFFSGHGIEIKGHSYLVVTDTEFDDDGNIINAVSLEELNCIIRNCKANLKIRLFDACQCGESFSKGIVSGIKMTRKMKENILASGNGWITFCSCDIDEYSREINKLKHGVFTYCLLEGLKGKARRGRGKMHIEDLKIYICNNVPQIVNDLTNPQNPQYQCEIEGNILIE